MGLNENFNQTAPKCRSVRLTRNDDSDACVSILQISHLLGVNGVECGFHCESSKMSLR